MSETGRALGFFIGAALGSTLCMQEVLSAEVPKWNVAHPVCPSHFWIAQRHDKRNAKGEIIRAHWRITCLTDRK